MRKDRDGQGRVKTVRILLADRNRHVRELLRRELELEGYQVMVARDASEILGVLARGEIPDLLILDFDLPFLAEVQLLEKLKQNLPNLPVIIHSFQLEEPSSAGMPAATVFLEKAEDPNRLKNAIAALVQK